MSCPAINEDIGVMPNHYPFHESLQCRWRLKRRAHLNVLHRIIPDINLLQSVRPALSMTHSSLAEVIDPESLQKIKRFLKFMSSAIILGDDNASGCAL